MGTGAGSAVSGADFPGTGKPGRSLKGRSAPHGSCAVAAAGGKRNEALFLLDFKRIEKKQLFYTVGKFLSESPERVENTSKKSVRNHAENEEENL